MKKLIVAGAIVFGVTVVQASPASAAASDHNCAGVVSSFLARALDPGQFGQAVASIAPVNDLGFANCGAT